MMNFILYPPKNPIAFDVCGFPVFFYGIIITFAIFLGIFLSYVLISKKYSKKEAEIFIDFIPYVVIFSIIGARLFYIVGNLSFYIKNPMEMIMINHGGLSIYGGLLFGIAAFVYFCKKNKLNTLKLFDMLALAMPLCQAIGRWGNFCNQEAYGKPSAGFIKMYIDLKHRNPELLSHDYYHPAFLYESILNFILFMILMYIFLKFKKNQSGTIFYLYLIFYSIIRIFVENFRIDSVLYVNNFPIASVISFIVLLVGIFLLIQNKKHL